ncbi:MAG: hypothetical protein HN909_08095 [Phycisphaerales bacterium]|jgi:hypothetical protein|nr:hypothetical protein [Phycisphaerales bacterium]MBT7171716.1 hypothetical protein [Phycisphaerales bacterium]
MTIRTIEVSKRDGSVEPFCEQKLSGAMWRSLQITTGDYHMALELSRAIGLFLQRQATDRVDSVVLFELALKALRRIRRGDAAERMELFHTLRSVRRRLVDVHHPCGEITRWDKGWCAKLAVSMWGLQITTGRQIASEIELELLDNQHITVDRSFVVDRINEKVSEFGLAEAMPLHPAQYSA